MLNLSQQKREDIFSIRIKLSYYKIFHRKFISNRNEKKTQMLMNKLLYLGLSKLDLGKTVMYEVWYDYLKPKYGENVKLCYIDSDSFIVPVKTDYIYKDIAKRY